MGLKEEILKLTNTAPIFKEADEDFEDDVTRAKVDATTGEFDDELDFEPIRKNNNRRIRAGIADLSEYGAKYKGKKVSRKQIDSEEEVDEDEELDEEDDEVDGEEEEDDDELDDEEDEEEEEVDEIEVPKAKRKRAASDASNEVDIVSGNSSEEVAKGKAVKNQLNCWDILLETRCKLQSILNMANQLPRHQNYQKSLDGLNGEQKKHTEDLIKESEVSVAKAMNAALELQSLLFLADAETSKLVNKPDEETLETVKKRKKSGIEEEKEEESEDEEDEEIFSDTDEENAANERKKLKTDKKVKSFNFKPLKADKFETYLEKINKDFKKYRNATIQKWYDKTRLTTGKSLQSFEKPIMQQIEHLLMDKERLLKRTQLKRSLYEICGEEQAKIESVDELKSQHMKDYDEEIFDDQDFYNQLLRELIDRKTTNVLDPVELSRRSIEMQKLRSKSKKKVDTKASKGRKIRFEIHKPLMNFMAPIYKAQMSEEARNELFRSLLGGLFSTKPKQANEKTDTEININSLFKKIA